MSETQSLNFVDTAWVLLASFLVFFMMPGLAIYEAGLLRIKNAANAVMKNILAASLTAVVMGVLGFTLAFGPDWNGFVGSVTSVTNLDLKAEWPGAPIPTGAFLIFQTMFAAVTLALISGAAVERMRYSAFLIFAVVYAAVLWTLPAHWIWGGGFLAQMGMMDFAGGMVVHGAAGAAGLAIMVALGPIRRRGTEKYASNLPLVALGGLILWFGWFGFNPGSVLAVNETTAIVAVTTNLAAGASMITAMGLAWSLDGYADVPMSVNGILAGLVAITPAAAFVSPLSAIIIGVSAGFIVFFGTKLIWRAKRIDDPVGMFPCHGLNGMFGTIAVGLFAEEGFAGVNGLFFGGGVSLLSIQTFGVAVVFLFVFLASYGLLKAMNLISGIRVSPSEEEVGLDFFVHGKLP